MHMFWVQMAIGSNPITLIPIFFFFFFGLPHLEYGLLTSYSLNGIPNHCKGALLFFSFFFLESDSIIGSILLAGIRGFI